MRGKVYFKGLCAVFLQDHPRACGEKFCIWIAKTLSLGSPPRMRGKVYGYTPKEPRPRITPAHAGKSHDFLRLLRCCRDHPRACGEKPRLHTAAGAYLGSPPRMRGKVLVSFESASADGITPAHAGKRTMTTKNYSSHKDHPRACGEKRRSTAIKTKR